ncbi:MAG: hypothetical protein AB1758_17695 [Candidatus Eremiobacterota bacterium]
MDATRQIGSNLTPRELDPGKSTQKGSINYAATNRYNEKNKSVITDADTMIEISEILAGTKKAKMEPEQLAEKLRERGYQVEVTQVDGRKAIRFSNGDMLVDSAGDASIGAVDIDVASALTQVEQRFGVNLGNLKQTWQAAALNDHEVQKRLGIYSGEDSALGLLGGNLLAEQMQQMLAGLGMDPGVLEDLEAALAELDPMMAEKGHQGPTAYELWNRGDLSPTLARLGLPAMNFPSPYEVAYPSFLNRSAGLFSLAYQLAAP